MAIRIAGKEIAGSKLVLAAAAGVVATGAVAASAASLGTLNAESLGTSSTVVAACQDGGGEIDIAWGEPTYAGNANPANSTYNVATVDFSNVEAACDGLSYKVTLADDTGASIGEVDDTVSLTAGEFTATFAPAVDSKAVEQVTLTIYG